MTPYLGWAGTLLLASAAIPQTLKVWREGHAKGMSWYYLVLLLLGFLCMGSYSYARQAGWPLVTSYGLQVVLFTLMAIRKASPRV